MCIGERGRYTDGSLAAGRGLLREVPDKEIPKVEGSMCASVNAEDILTVA